MENDHSLDSSRYPLDVTAGYDNNATHPVDPSPGVFSLTDADDDGSHGNQMSDDGSGGNASHLGVVRTRRRKVSAEGSELRLCVVCEERATGYNFDRLTCESCKAFFRRNALKAKDKIKPCTRGGNCDVTGAARKHCPTCRLRKCFRMGMKKELILPPEKLELRAKPRRRVNNSVMGHDMNSLAPPPGQGPHGLPGNPMGNPGLAMRSVSCSDPSAPVPLTAVPGHAGPLASGTHFSYDIMSAVARLNEHVGSGTAVDNHTVMIILHGPIDHLVPKFPIVTEEEVCELRRYASHMFSIKVITLNNVVANSFMTGPGPIPSLPPAMPPGDDLMGLPRLNPSMPEPKHRPLSPLETPQVLHYISRTDFNPEEALILDGLRECSQHLREPFPQPPSGAGEESNWEPQTLEEMYNSMDMCIRRIIRVVKSLPFFSEISKESQIQVLRANIYGLIVIHGSFFYHKSNQCWRYPLQASSGQQRLIEITMYSDSLDCRRRESPSHDGVNGGAAHKEPFLLREFRRYRGNLLHVNELLADLCTDDILLVALLALKLFNSDGAFGGMQTEGESAPSPQTVLGWRRKVDEMQGRYATFLQHYLTRKRGPSAGVQDYSRIILTLVDVRTLEVRMKEFAKFLSSEGLSPLMREVCHH